METEGRTQTHTHTRTSRRKDIISSLVILITQTPAGRPAITRADILVIREKCYNSCLSVTSCSLCWAPSHTRRSAETLQYTHTHTHTQTSTSHIGVALCNPLCLSTLLCNYAWRMDTHTHTHTHRHTHRHTHSLVWSFTHSWIFSSANV